MNLALLHDAAKFALTLAAMSALSCCALLGKGKPLELRYFDLAPDAGAAPVPAAPAGARLRLGQVSAARHIDRRFVSRQSAHELSYHEEWRWTDEPDTFLRRALSRDLFERAGLIRVVSGAAPSLEVELTAFEAVREGDHTHAHAAVLAQLQDDRVQLWQRAFEMDAPLGEGDPAEALADALGRALAAVAGQVAEQTVASLPEPAKPAQPGSPAALTPSPPATGASDAADTPRASAR
jgi:cholesterol transport system auxiliary component